MSFVVLLAGSPGRQSRSTSLLRRATHELAAHGIAHRLVGIGDLPLQELVYGASNHPDIQQFQHDISRADGLIVATPVYKAAYSGVFKLLLDILPERALNGKAVLPIGVGGSPNHMLAVDYALKPVLSSLKARTILEGIYATENQITYQPDGTAEFDPDLQSRLDSGLARFLTSLPQAPAHHNPALLADRIVAAQLGI
ncbi:MAG: NADPH-dependent FMN reductase [Burkholderiales bacterium]|nr:NADPH-dependent FMN reductase [Burkholderiales bacterium]